MNVPSLSTLMKDITAFVPYYTLVGKSFQLDKDISIGGIDFKINQVNITNLVIADGKVNFVGDSDTVRTTIKGADITLNIDAEATSFIPVPLDITSVFIKNVTLELDLATTTSDEVHWQLVESSLVSIEDVTVNCTQKIW